MNLSYLYGWLKDPVTGKFFAPKTTTNHVLVQSDGKKTLSDYLQEIDEKIDDTAAIAKGASRAKTYDNYQQMISDLNSLSKDELNQGQNIMIVALNVPDLWVNSVADESVQYTYVDDATCVDDLQSDGSMQVGHFVLSQLESGNSGATYDVGGEELGLVKSGGNVTINPDGTMTAHSDWDATDASKGAIKNKPPIENGTGEKSIAIGDGEALGKYSVAGGTNDTSLVSDMIGISGSLASIDKPTAYEDMSLSFGAGTKALSVGTIAIGANTSAGCRGFYYWSIDFTNKVITLSTNQKPIILEARKWTDEAKTQLGNWKVDDIISIVNDKHYVLCSKITAIDTNAGTITVDNIPFDKIESQVAPTAQDYAVICPRKPTVGTVKLGFGAFSIGYENKATGIFAHAEGVRTEASGEHSHSEGDNTTASGHHSHAEGGNTTASGSSSHAEGGLTRAVGNFSHAQGYQTYSGGSYAHIEGKSDNALPMTVEDRTYDHTSSNDELLERWSSNKFALAKGKASHVEGVNCLAFGVVAHAEGNSTIASGPQSHAEGMNTEASSYSTHAEGEKTKAFGPYSHAEGIYTVARGDASHAEGRDTTASGNASHAEGRDTTAWGDYSHAEGLGTTASGYVSHAEGLDTTASGYYSHAEGLDTTAWGDYQHVQGKYNVRDTENNYAHIVGGGTSSDTPLNLHTIRWSDGQGFFKGGTTSEGADYAEFFEWLDGNPDKEDRVGLLVTLDEEKIRLANNGDEILGIISGTAAVLGDNYECEWNGKYLTDDFGRVIYDLVEEFVDVEHIEFKEVEKEVIDEETNETRIEIELEEVKTVEKKSTGFWKHPRLNPDYDPEQTYVNRADRPEWDTVGMLGKLYVRDDGTCIPNYYATVGGNGIATLSLEKTNMRVLSRVNENIVRVLLK